MVGLCITSLNCILLNFIALSHFELFWQHSREHFFWYESYIIDQSTSKLGLVKAIISTTGAGVDLPEDAVFIDDHWEYKPDQQLVLPEILLANWYQVLDYNLCSDSISCRSLRSYLPDDQQYEIVRLSGCKNPGVVK